MLEDAALWRSLTSGAAARIVGGLPAKALGLAVADKLLAHADEVIG